MTRSWLHLIAAAALAVPLGAAAVDAPHDGSFTSGSCTECHALHLATGGTGAPTNATVCLSCHAGKSPRVNWNSSDQAAATAGTSHRWDSSITNPAAGALPPLTPALASRVPGNVLQCSTCHDVHKGAAFAAPGSGHLSLAVGTALTTTSGGAGGKLTLQPLVGTPAAKGYRVKVVAGGGFILSHDFKTAAPTWFNWIANAWQVGVDGGTGRPFTIGTPVQLDDPGGSVSVAFSGTPAPGDSWDFYVAYPFVRAFTFPSQSCIDCHRERDQDHFIVEGTPGFGWGGTPYSHPVGENLTTARQHRAVPLDANGAVQGSAGRDGDASNDLELLNGSVTCLSCHAPHEADSNSLTTDAR
jgi:predicted CXXCH cytochrome family protein